MKRIVIVIFLALFVAFSATGAATARCHPANDHAPSKTTESAVAMDHGAHHHGATHHAAGVADKACAKAQEGNHAPPGDDAGQADCLHCSGGLCSTSSLIAFNNATLPQGAIAHINVEKALNLKQVLLSTIPEPPRRLS